MKPAALFLLIAAVVPTATAAPAYVTLANVKMADVKLPDGTLLVVRAFGLLGDWAENCSADAGYGNWRVTYYQSDTGRVRRRATRSLKEGPLDGAIDDAVRLTATTLRLLVRYDDGKWGAVNGVRFETVIEVADGQGRSLNAKDKNGRPIITDGKLGNGQPAPVFQRCSANAS